MIGINMIKNNMRHIGLLAVCLVISCHSPQARGQTVLRSGNYVNKKSRWAFHCNLSQALEGLGFLFKTVEQVHPNHLANLSKAEYRQVQERSRIFQSTMSCSHHLWIQTTLCWPLHWT